MKKLTVLTFLILLCGCAVLTAAAFTSQAVISEKENRSLQTFKPADILKWYFF